LILDSAASWLIFFVPDCGIGFSIGQPARIPLAAMLEAHGSLLLRDKGWSFWLGGSSTA
jgi:hypothetical protein